MRRLTPEIPSKVVNEMKYTTIILYSFLIFSCKKNDTEKLDFTSNKAKVDSSSELYTKDDNRSMDHNHLTTLKKNAVNGDKSAIFSLFNYHTYGTGDHEKAYYWGYLHDKIDKSQNLSQLAEDNIKGSISEFDRKKDDPNDTGDEFEIPYVEE